MHYCYRCKHPINKVEKSKEHVINRCIGGHLKATILCKKCNEIFGTTIDVSINDQLRPYAFLLGCKLDGEQFSGGLKLKSLSGKEKILSPGMHPFDQIRAVKNESVIFDYPVASDKFSAKMLRKKKELERKGDKYIGTIHEVPPPEEKYFIIHPNTSSPNELAFGGSNFHRAISKMCLNYYLYNNLPIKYCQNLLSYVVNNNFNQINSFYYPTNTTIHPLKTNEVSHILHIRGDTEYGILYAYIELFNMICMIVPFSFTYTGEDINHTYSWDLINAVLMNKKLNLPLARHHLEAMPIESKYMAMRIEPAQQRLLRIIEARQASRLVS